jgi:hypothetical protein
LALEYPQAQQCGRSLTEQLNAIGVKADGLRLDGQGLEGVQEAIEHLQPKRSVSGIDVA